MGISKPSNPLAFATHADVFCMFATTSHAIPGSLHRPQLAVNSCELLKFDHCLLGELLKFLRVVSSFAVVQASPADCSDILSHGASTLNEPMYKALATACTSFLPAVTSSVTPQVPLVTPAEVTTWPVSTGQQNRPLWQQQQQFEAGVDWPWKPRDLEALQQRFRLVVDTDKDPGLEAFDDVGDAGSVLTWTGFFTFWSGLQKIMPEVSFGGGAVLLHFRICHSKKPGGGGMP